MKNFYDKDDSRWYIIWEISVIDMADVIRTTLLGEVILIEGKGERMYIYTSSKFVEEMDDFNGG